MAASPRSFNDVRTLILGHDKRILAVLSRPELVADLLDPADVDVLSRHLIPTFHATEVRRCDSLAEPAAWVLKRNSSGRGIDLLVGAACPADAWRQAVLDASRGPHGAVVRAPADVRDADPRCRRRHRR